MESSSEIVESLKPVAAVSTIPVLHSSGLGLPEAWERSVARLLVDGADAPTQYDRPGDPPSKDCMAVIEIQEPLREPRIHRFFPGGPADLEEYCLEVMEGVKNHWTRNPGDPEDKRWSYTYHGRITQSFGVDQLQRMVEKLSGQPFTRQAQFTTWMPASDPDDYDPPCLQRGWARVLRCPKTDELQFHGHVYLRSWDALKAGFMNLFAFIRLFDEQIRQPVQEALNQPLVFKRFVGVGDSYHVYGKDFKEITAFTSKIGQRFYYKEDDDQQPWFPMMVEARPEIARKIAEQDANRKEQAHG